MTQKTPPRLTPDRDSKYMGLAWIHAAFSKDPSTQVGSVIVSNDNKPLGSGYNGLPSQVDDDLFDWSRPPVDDPEAYSKYDMMVHAEANAIDHCCGDLFDATLYCIALPCPICMREIVRKKIGRVVYMNYQSHKSSMLQNTRWREKSFQIAQDAGTIVHEFDGDLDWLPDWIDNMKQLGIFKRPEL
jgi:dCMP deaminase